VGIAGPIIVFNVVPDLRLVVSLPFQALE